MPVRQMRFLSVAAVTVVVILTVARPVVAGLLTEPQALDRRSPRAVPSRDARGDLRSEPRRGQETRAEPEETRDEPDEPAADPDLPRKVRRLIDQLGAATRAERMAAEAGLLQLGAGALVHLPPPELISTPSKRAAVDRVRQELERRQARESVNASRVTLTGTRSIEEWAAEIARQSGNALSAASLPDEVRRRQLEMTLRDREFWRAVDELADRAGLTHKPDTTRRGLKFVVRDDAGDDDSAKPAALRYVGPFRLTAPPAEVVRKRLARVDLLVQPEPRLRPLFLHYAAADVTATANSHALAPFSPEASYEIPIGDSSVPTRLQLDFVLPQGALPGAVDLAGKIRMTTAAATAAIRFADVATPADGKDLGLERRRGGVTVRLERARRERCPGGLWDLRVQVVVAYDTGGPAFESHRTWILHNEVYLEDPDGTRLPLNGGYETTLQADGAVGMEYRFRELPDPLPEYAFVYVAPMLIVDVPIEFQIESVSIRNDE